VYDVLPALGTLQKLTVLLMDGCVLRAVIQLIY
jgi:hypothetical protein